MYGLNSNSVLNIAHRLGISPATVSKVLHHSFGVSSQRREQVYQLAEQLHYAPTRVTPFDVYVILPELPSFFWKQLYIHLSSALSEMGLRADFHIYSSLKDRSMVERYLNEAERLHAKLILIAANYPGLDTRLEALSNTCGIITLCEDSGSDRIFSVGSDQRADGALLARHCLSEHPEAKRILLLGRSGERLNGFMDTVGHRADVRFVPSDQRQFNNASQLSRILFDLRSAYPFDLAVYLSGNTKDLYISLKKCRLQLPCYGFEDQMIEKRYAQFGGTVIQDLEGIAECAARYADVFLRRGDLPAVRHTGIPSIYRKYCPDSLI